MEDELVGDIPPLGDGPVVGQVDKHSSHASQGDDGIDPREVHHDGQVKDGPSQCNRPRVVFELGSTVITSSICLRVDQSKRALAPEVGSFHRREHKASQVAAGIREAEEGRLNGRNHIQVSNHHTTLAGTTSLG